MQILIIEDEVLYADKIEMLVEKLGYQHLDTIDNSESALKVVLQKAPDLIIMDININGDYDGIDLANIINNKYKLAIPIIFITSLKDDATFKRAMQTGAANFLIKPFNELQVQRNIQLALIKSNSLLLTNDEPNDIEKQEVKTFKNFFFVKIKDQFEKIMLADILFFKADGHYSEIHTLDKKILVRSSLINLISKFEKDLFSQTHRSFFVNLKKVSAISLADSTISFGEKEASIGIKYRENIKLKLNFLT